jgi:hypothetical protein
MSETMLTYMIVFAELGGVLLLVALIGGIYFIVKTKNEGNTTKNLISFTKGLASSARNDMMESLKEKFIDNDEVDIETLIQDEQKLYRHLIKFSINKDTGLLKSATSDIHSLVSSYVQLLAQQPDIETESDDVKKSKVLKEKKENESLRIEIASLEARLQNATDTIETMMGEFSSMYEGGKDEEGEQQVKNEMYKLKKEMQAEDEKVKSDLSHKEKE